jgi:hypothetical protein
MILDRQTNKQTHTRGKRLLKLLYTLSIRDRQCVQVSAASDLELVAALDLLDLDGYLIRETHREYGEGEAQRIRIEALYK